MQIRGSLQHMAEGELIKLVSPDTMERLKAVDDSPLIQVYCVAEEGESVGNYVGQGNVSMEYPQQTIVEMGDHMNHGLPAFNRHQKGTNSTQGRESVGELVGKCMRMVGGKLRTLAAIYIKPEHRDKGFDVASVETNLSFSKKGPLKYLASKVLNVTGIALGNSRVDKPGFRSAVLQGEFQFLIEQEEKETQSKEGEKESMALSLAEIKKAALEGGWSPSDIFGKKGVLEDPVIKDIIEQKDSIVEKTQTQLKEEKDARAKDAKDFTEKQNGLTKEIIKTKAPTEIKKVLDLKKIDGKKAEFIIKKAEKFNPTNLEGDGFLTEVKAFVDEHAGEFDSLASMFGVAGSKEAKKGNEEKTGASGSEADDSSNSGTKDLTKRENNPLIPK